MQLVNVCLITSWLSLNSHDYHACPVYNKCEELDCGFFPKCTPLFLQRTCYIQTYYQQIQQIPKNVAKSYPVIGDVNSQCVVKVIHNLHKFLTLEKKSLPRCEQSLFSTILDGSNNIICSEFKCHVYMVA